MTEEQLRDKVEELNESNESLKGEVSELSKKNSVLESAYNALMAKVDGLMAKIGLSDTTEK
jgi:cell division protein FtsL